MAKRNIQISPFQKERSRQSNRLIMQKGFATLEIIFAVFIIAVLMSCAIPNVVRIIDTVAFDYETKKFYSDLRFLQAVNRSGKFNTSGMGRSFIMNDSAIFMKINKETNSYQILRGDNTPLREAHYMRNLKKMEFGGNISSPIQFDATGRVTNQNNSNLDGTITLTSRLGKTSKIVFNSVGRIRGGRDDE